ncbi:MBL fold metallo-hydrolase [Kutzneria viridogrisea]|uniref:Metallo-beta-lactamase domain-containing protein n=2 Tax=Kutzneria TaxID=43356 RepID=W5WIR7_9PSEU|nr:MBL fold metallo-hydrolase [Kutzneria albida]AHI00497.1 hypothetical protein KALB_7139 [Kutzneria albida DSM 43870]MBA8925676.1 glyoxylase-like metal-dependent hydrolase (beta-lactamase superfamily II) [Kutzneria viridogrisea]
MRVHHLNCGTMRPPGGRLISGTGSVFAAAEMVCHCLLVETEQGLVLIDTGLGLDDVRHPAGSLPRPFTQLTRPVLAESETAVRQVVQLGYSPEDVRHIVLTHLDLDHAGGLRDFPHAKVHVHETELRAARAQASAADRSRYRTAQWAHNPDWEVYPEPDGEHWFGFAAVRDLRGLPPEILLVPLAGHTVGHAGIAVDTGQGWLLHAGDSYFFHEEVNPVSPRCTPGLRAFQNMVQFSRRTRLDNQARLRALVGEQAGKVAVFSAHDPVELARHRRP